TELLISHINYGQWGLNDAEVKAAITLGVISQEKTMFNLYPVTVIALHKKNSETQTLQLNYRDKMAHDGGAVLNQTPVINSIRKSANYGFDPVLRGFKYDQLNVVFNGAQSATAACPNRMDPPTSQMAPNMIDRIEILKGPHALRYGNSFGGTINFVPAALRYAEKNDLYARWSAGYDSNGNNLRTEGLVGMNGKRYDLGIFAAWSEGDDYTDGDNNTVSSSFQRASFGANLGLKIAKRQELRISATRNVAKDVAFVALPMDLRKDHTWMLNASHQIDFQNSSLKKLNSSVYGTFVDHRMDNFLKPLDPRILNAATDATTNTYGGRTEAMWKSGKGILYAGADLRVEEAEGIRTREFLKGPKKGKTFYDNAWQHGQIRKTGLFAEYHLRQNALQFVFSGRLEMNHSTIFDVAEEFANVYPETDATQVNPSLSIGGIKNFKNDISLGLWLGRAQRSGSLTERFINYFSVGQDPYELLGNPQLNPEINNQLDFTFEHKTFKSAIKLDLFMAYLQDNISSVIDTSLTTRLPKLPGVRKFINIDKAFKTGFEVTWSQNLTMNLQHQLSLAYTYAKDLELNEPLPEIAPFDLRYRIFASYLKDKLRPEISFRYVASQKRISKEYGESESPAFSILDLKVAYRLNQFFNITTGVQNLFDSTYYEHLSRSVKGNMPHPIYAPGRNFFLSLSFDLM
ncbi:MAG TPA: TonB-dependent receptor, partial [Saprospiraceae bacterium]|nr:TonB-dependent receptor [Saprospiraceae bacterium]